MIGIVDYGLGNVRAFENVYRALGISAKPVRTAEDMLLAEKLILPGVGSFDWAMSKLASSRLIDPLNEAVQVRRVPVLGVCVGLQMMAESSTEGTRQGLGWIPGTIERLDRLLPSRVNLPHMGWNDVAPIDDDPLYSRMTGSPRFYFLHSYAFVPRNAANVSATTSYGGGSVVASIRQDNIWATQFHPEKSHSWGVSLLRNFSEIV